jgi:hypothetical protein
MPDPIAPNPVMDVVTPRPKAPSAAYTSPEPMAVAPPEEIDPKAKPSVLAPPQAQQKAPPKPKPPKQPGSGVTAAIFATVVIVFGLALLAVYAYLKQNK